MGRRAITEVCGSGAFALEQDREQDWEQDREDEPDPARPMEFPAFPAYSMTFTAFHGPFPMRDAEASSPGVWESGELPLPQLHDDLLPTGTLQWCGVPIDD